MPYNSISFHHATVYMALAKKHSLDAQNVAMAFDNDGSIICIAMYDSRDSFGSYSSIVNLIQNHSGKPFDIISTTSKPSDCDKGMARMAKVKKINYLEVNQNTNALMTLNLDTALNSPWKPPTKIIPNKTKTKSEIPILDNPKPETASNWYDTHIKDRDTYKSGDPSLNAKIGQAKSTYDTASRYDRPFERTLTDLTLPNNFVNVPNGRQVDNDLRHKIFMHQAWAIVGESIGRRDPKGPYPDGHLIGSVLRGPNDEILAWGLNTNAEHWSLHGEVNLIQTYQNRINGEITGANDINKRPILYSTLEPCYMCAGMYVQSGTHVYCYYGQKDSSIVNNALKNSNQQILIQTKMGTLVTSAVASGGRMKESMQTTKVLNEAIDQLLLFAYDFYFDLVPEVNSPDRANWVKQPEPNKTPESYIWENGLRLLHHINPGVVVKWFRSDRYYDVADFPKKFTANQLETNRKSQ